MRHLRADYRSVSRWSDLKLRFANSDFLSTVLQTRDFTFKETLPSIFGNPSKVITYVRLTNLFNAMFYHRIRETSFFEARRFSQEVDFMLKHWAVFQFENVYNKSVFKELRRNWIETYLHLPDLSGQWIQSSLYEAEDFDIQEQELCDFIKHMHSNVLNRPREWNISRLIVKP